MAERAGFNKVMVIGTGLMGPGITITYASTGLPVTMYARTQASVDRGLAAVKRGVQLLAENDCMTGSEAELILALVDGTTDFEMAAAPADLVTESIVEDLAVKRELFQRLEGVCRAETVLTSNTSGLPATLIAEPLQRPERFAVTHFWNPPHLMPLVEIVKGERTDLTVVDRLFALLREAGKKPVRVLKDTPGQLGNRLFHALIREAIYIVESGTASAEDVDTAIRNGLGRRFPVYGTLEHQDVVGLDMVLAIQSYMTKALCNSTEPSPILVELVQNGNLGVKSGNGFFDWNKRDVKEVVRVRDQFLIDLLRKEKGLV